MKNGRYSKIEKFYIEANAAKQTPEEIASALGREVSSVIRQINRLQQDNPPSQPLPEAPPANTTDDGQKTQPPKTYAKGEVRNLFAVREGQGVVCMTETASVASDETRASRINNNHKLKKYQTTVR